MAAPIPRLPPLTTAMSLTGLTLGRPGEDGRPPAPEPASEGFGRRRESGSGLRFRSRANGPILAVSV